MACCAAVAIGALGLSTSSASASERYWRGQDTFCGSGGGTDCPTAINRYGHREYRDYRRDYRRHGEYRHRDHYRRDYRRYHGQRRYHGGPGIGIYLGVPVVPDYAPRRAYREVGPSDAHVRWCHNRYRSYRAWDNTFQPYHGPRQQCWSPYS
jgi:hypothetical protein